MATQTKTKQKLSGKQWGILITLIFLYFFAPEFGAISPTLALMPDWYGITSAECSWITAFANPAECISGIFVGLIVGRKISYKTCGLLATGIFALCGGIPFIWQDIPFAGLLVARLLFGFGVGCLMPLSQSIVTHMFIHESDRARWIGILYIVFSIGASVGTTITGALCVGGIWQNAYAFYLLGVIPFVMVLLFFKDEYIMVNQEAKKVDEAVASASKEEKRHIPGVAAAFIIVFGLGLIMTQAFFNYAGIAIAENGIDPLVVGTIFSVITAVGIIIAIFNSFIWKAMRLYSFPAAFIFFILSYAVALVAYGAASLPLWYAAAIIMGFGMAFLSLSIPMVMSVTVAPAALTLAIGLQEAARNAGGFCSAIWLNAVGSVFGDVPTVQFTAIVILGIVLAAIALVLAIKNNKRFKGTDYQG